MPRLSEAQRAALEPLRRALIAAAEAEAAQVREDAASAARDRVDAARRHAEAVLARARSDGEADAAAWLVSQRAAARRAARAVVLGAQLDVYEQLMADARTAVRRLLSDPVRRRALEDTLRKDLGGQAALRAEPGGGIIAEAADGRRIDASARSLVDAAVTTLELERLWRA